MATHPAGVKRAVKRRREKRDGLWPDAEGNVFNPSDGGWAQTPRTIPLVGALIDLLSDREKAGRLYMTLWSHEFGDGFVEVADPALLALESGYLTNRAERSFNERMSVLNRLGFVRTAPLGFREFAFVLLLDPHKVVSALRAQDPKRIPDHWWTVFVARCTNAGIKLPSWGPDAAKADAATSG